jgi:isopentenyl-diphosphate delta-isomerase
MPKVTQISSRKADHIRINLEEDVSSGLSSGLEAYTFTHQALPELDLNEIELGQKLFGKELRAPILISSMTGGTEPAGEINRILATAAQEVGISMGLGSQRAAIENPELIPSFQVRQVAPDILLFANLGAVQLNYGYGIEQCLRAVEMIEADALYLHLNPLQEAVQPEGDVNFSGLLTKIEQVCRSLPVPVIAKEVGWGFSEQAARQLAEVGIAAIDISGAGGTSWTQVEMHRAETQDQASLAATFLDWGIPTSESILNVRAAAPQLPIIASGGIRNGLDITKCVALGATLGGLASPFLKAANQSLERTIASIQLIKRQIQVTMFAAGIPDIERLKHTRLRKHHLPGSNNKIHE